MQRVPQICAAIILASLFLPGALVLMNVGRSQTYINTVEQRQETPFPAFPTLEGSDHRRTGIAVWFAVFERAWSDHFPFRGLVIDRHRRFDIAWGGRNYFGQVSIGQDGWLFLREDCGATLRGESGVADFRVRLESLFALAAQHAKPVHVVVIPPKHAIYPEMMGRAEQNATQRHTLVRRRLVEELERFDRTRVIAVEELYRRAKSSAPSPVYLPKDSHHSRIGAPILGRAIIDAVDPTLWDTRDERLEEIEVAAGDLTGLFGLAEPSERQAVRSVRRPGVAFQRTEVAEPRPQSLRPVHYVTTSTEGRRLISGRTVFVRDSFIQSFLEPTLAQYFADVTFLHYHALSRAQFERAFRECDRLVFAVAEREAINQFRRLVRVGGPAAVVEVVRRDWMDSVKSPPPIGGVLEKLEWNPRGRTVDFYGWAAFDTRSVNSRIVLIDPLGRLGDPKWARLEPVLRPDVAAMMKSDWATPYFGFSISMPVLEPVEQFGQTADLEIFAVDPNGTVSRLVRPGRPAQ